MTDLRRRDDRPIRVAHLTWRLSQTGGIPLVIRRLLREIDRRDVEPVIITIRPPGADDRLGELGHTTVVPLGFDGRLGLRGRARATVAAWRALRRNRPDVLHLHSGTASYALPYVLRGAPTTYLDVHDGPGNGRHGRATEWLEGWLCRRLGVIPIVHSSSVAAQVVEHWRVDRERVRLVPLGIEIERFRRDAAARRRFRDEHGFVETVVLLYVARLVPSKDVDSFLDLGAALCDRDVALVVVGDGPEADRLRRRVVDGGRADRVRFLGSRDGQALVDCFSGSDAFVSTSAYEGFGLAIVEAMAAGLPVVAVAVGGVTDLVEDGVTGHLVPPGRFEELVARVEALLDDEDLRRGEGAAAERRAAERFSAASMGRGYADIYAGADP